MSNALPWIIVLSPLVAAFLIVLITKSSSLASGFVSIAAVLISFLTSCAIFPSPNRELAEANWIDLSPLLNVPFGFVLDPLSKTMLVLVTFIGSLIHIYSLGYMRDDPGKSRYFAGLSFFMFAMLG